MRSKNEERIAALEADGYEVHVQHDRLMLGGEALEKGGRTTVHAWKAPGGRTFCGVANCHPTKDRFNEHIGLTIALNRLEHEIRVEEAHVFPMIELKFSQDFTIPEPISSFREALFGRDRLRDDSFRRGAAMTENLPDDDPSKVKQPEPEEGDRVVITECPSHPDRVGRGGVVTLKRTLAGGGYDYSVLLDQDDKPTGQYPEYAVELDDDPVGLPAAEVKQRPDVVQKLYEMGADLGLSPERIDKALDEDVKADAARAKAEDRARQAEQQPLRRTYDEVLESFRLGARGQAPTPSAQMKDAKFDMLGADSMADDLKRLIERTHGQIDFNTAVLTAAYVGYVKGAEALIERVPVGQ